jgi:regulator of sirC expression with transglutaminase-like and TPR domain
VVIDPFNGHSLTKEDLMERLSPLYAESGLAREGDISDELLKHYLRSASPREIMTRMLRNLEEVYGSQDDAERLDAVKKRLKVLLPSLDETD